MASVRVAKPSESDDICRLHRRSIRELCASQYTTSEIEEWQARQRAEKYLPFIERREIVVAVRNSGADRHQLDSDTTIGTESDGGRREHALEKSEELLGFGHCVVEIGDGEECLVCGSCRQTEGKRSQVIALSPSTRHEYPTQVAHVCGDADTTKPDTEGFTGRAQEQECTFHIAYEKVEGESELLTENELSAGSHCQSVCTCVSARIAAVYVSPDAVCQGIGRLLLIYFIYLFIDMFYKDCQIVQMD